MVVLFLCLTLSMAKRLEKKPDHWSDIVGMPDEFDKKNIQTIINNFKRQKFNVEGAMITGKMFIELEVADAKRMHQAESGWNPYNMKAQETESRAVIAMPIPLDMIIKEAYPTMFRDTKHFGWFMKHFGKEFQIAEKY